MVENTAFYITTPIYYVNDVPHLGHAYTSLACDVLARFKRLDGYQVKFLTGTDEHGLKVQKAADAAGVTPINFTDRVSQNFRDLCQTMKFSIDDFIRTTEERHYRACSTLWQKLADAGHIYLGSYAGWYAVRDETYYPESELVVGASGQKLAPTGAPVEWVEEPSYFFRLSAWQDQLLEYYASTPDFILPESRRNEVVRFVEGGLQDLSISRTTFNWGIPVPGDPKHVMYVWLDALTNYISAMGYPNEQTADFRTFWPANVHMVGKDILRFHAVWWPAFLMAAGVAPPRRVFAHGWWTNEGQKMSKSLGNVVDPNALVEHYGLDSVRYFLLREIPFGQDGDFSHRAMVGRINGDLANDFGNLAQRVLSMIARNCGGVVPTCGPFAEDDERLLGAAASLVDQVRNHLDRQMFHLALTAIWQVIGDANGYVDRQAPWALKKSDPPRMATVLYVLAETLRYLGMLTLAFMPDASGRLLDQLAVDGESRTLTHLDPTHRLVSGTALPPPVGLFPRYVEAGDTKGNAR